MMTYFTISKSYKNILELMQLEVLVMDEFNFSQKINNVLILQEYKEFLCETFSNIFEIRM